MLADSQDRTPQTGLLSNDVHLPDTFRHELIGFITNHLPLWRDDSKRPANTAETALTDHLCDYLSSAARRSSGWDIIHFRTEVTDERQKGRSIDLAPKPCGVTVWTAGRAYTQYEMLFPVECKVLPTPRDPKRDEREYVISKHSTTGGIQRFKAGDHGAAHNLAVMIAYIQKEKFKFWKKRTKKWVEDLAKANQSNWTMDDLLHHEKTDKERGIALLRSSHTRTNELPVIELRHLWVKMF